ncbi:hypothetical protein AB0933_32385 [Streptomyces venezuelae]|uniref:hypothetical protein n=1 Tax=Streptomyces venezuelae TaxID=54571 RepID=UPI0034517463
MTTTANTWAAKAKRLNALKRPTQVLTICEDPDARERLATAKAEAQQAADLLADVDQDDDARRTLYEARVKQTKTELAAAQKAFDAVAVTLTFTALERTALEQLQAKHPASEEQEADGDQFAMESFAPELIAAASVDGMPVDAARQYLDTWSAGDARALWNAAWSVQHTRRTDLGKG